MTIDKFVDENGEESDLLSTGDSIWNFHVWNEGWFRRPDLPKGKRFFDLPHHTTVCKTNSQMERSTEINKSFYQRMNFQWKLYK